MRLPWEEPWSVPAPLTKREAELYEFALDDKTGLPAAMVCKACGALVQRARSERHNEWHRVNVKHPEPAR